MLHVEKTQKLTTGFERSDRAQVRLLLKVLNGVICIDVFTTLTHLYPSFLTNSKNFCWQAPRLFSFPFFNPVFQLHFLVFLHSSGYRKDGAKHRCKK